MRLPKIISARIKAVEAGLVPARFRVIKARAGASPAPTDIIGGTALKGPLNLNLVALMLVVQTLSGARGVAAQTATDVPDALRPRADQATVGEFFDPSGGMTADEAVARALAANGELLAMRKEVEAARALVRQAGARANPRVDGSGAKAVNMPENQLMAEGMLPLELGGRRAARVRVAEREAEARAAALRDR